MTGAIIPESANRRFALVGAAFAPGANAAETARAAEICTSLLYRWRREFSGETSGAFSRAVLMDDTPAQPAAAIGAEPAMIVEFRSGERALIRADGLPLWWRRL